ncbi:MAG: hypothetical protein GC154_17345 [bacterium]|nr:hypothetical protein [bacterium]
MAWPQGTTGKHATISTRWVGEYSEEANTQGPAPGDIAMQILLQDNGVSARVVPDKFFYDLLGDFWLDNSTGEEHSIDLAILSGSSSSGDVPSTAELFAKGVPIMMGEHVCLAQEGRPGDIKMYIGGGEAHKDLRTNEIRQIKIVNKDHPITQGIQTDAEGWVQVFHDPYPGEGLFNGWLDTAPKQIIAKEGLYENRIALGSKSHKAPGTVILAEVSAEMAGSDDLVVCLAVLDKGAKLADGTTSPCRLVHWISNEEGSGGPHRNFLALNSVGRTLFVRACRWAMELEDVTAVVHSSLYD